MTGSNYSRGAWRGRGGHGRGGHPPSDVSHPWGHQKSLPCRQFQGNGTCKFGASCKFSHDPSPGHIAGERQPHRGISAPVHNEEDKTDYYEWKRLIRRRPSPREQDNRTTLEEIWSAVLRILNADSRESQQMLMKDLVDDNKDTFSCEYLYLTLQIRVNDSGLALGIVEDFLRTITHAAILDSLSIDTYVGNVYNMISGGRGDRAVSFFLDLSRTLATASGSVTSYVTHSRLDSCLCLILEALYQLFCREKRASFHEDLPQLFNNLAQLFDLLDVPGTAPKPVYISRRDRLDILRRIVNISMGLVDSGSNDQERSVNIRSAMSTVFPLHTPLPGGRHENDNMDIACISIVPTSAEITSEQPDYLPSTDCRQPHFHDDPVQRYLDTHFRLLRHDIFGPLKAVLGSLTHAFVDGKPPSQLPGRDMNAHLYQNASIAHISVHEKRGFEIVIDFSLPHHLRHKSAEERRRLWDASRRLEPGGLVCLLSSVDNEVVPILLLVSEKSAETSREQRRGFESHVGSIIVKLARLQPEDLQLLTQIYLKKGHGLLVALPGLIPATFTPVLQNLQKMIGVGELPFHQWIVPDPRRAEREIAHPDPPRYALRPGFSFSMDSIVTGAGEPISVTSRSSPNDPHLMGKLESLTGLDVGQCRALLWALTHEYALIQGPPGTGKSYLGVKLIQVLLDAKEHAKFGPIIIM